MTAGLQSLEPATPGAFGPVTPAGPCHPINLSLSNTQDAMDYSLKLQAVQEKETGTLAREEMTTSTPLKMPRTRRKMMMTLVNRKKVMTLHPMM